MDIAVLLFEDYETLDVFGPVEIFGRLTELYSFRFFSFDGGVIKNKHNVSILTENIQNLDSNPEIVLIPGGIGTRKVVLNDDWINKIREISELSKYVLTVCTGSALLAKTGLLDNRWATSNKKSFDWVITQRVNVNWDREARWVRDGKYYTSSGVSAGMDMSLGFLSDMHGVDFARKVSSEIEYRWNEDMNNYNYEVKS